MIQYSLKIPNRFRYLLDTIDIVYPYEIYTFHEVFKKTIESIIKSMSNRRDVCEFLIKIEDDLKSCNYIDCILYLNKIFLNLNKKWVNGDNSIYPSLKNLIRIVTKNDYDIKIPSSFCEIMTSNGFDSFHYYKTFNPILNSINNSDDRLFIIFMLYRCMEYDNLSDFLKNSFCFNKVDRLWFDLYLNNKKFDIDKNVVRFPFFNKNITG